MDKKIQNQKNRDLLKLCYNDQVDDVKTVLQNGANPNSYKGQCLNSSISHNNFELVELIALCQQTGSGFKRAYFQSALDLASKLGHIRIIEFFLFDKKIKYHPKIQENTILESKKDIRLKVFQYLKDDQIKNINMSTILGSALYDINFVKFICTHFKDRINLENNGFITSAVQKNSLDVVKYLLESEELTQHAKIDAVNISNKNLLQIACYNEHLLIAEYLLDNFNHFNIDCIKQSDCKKEVWDWLNFYYQNKKLKSENQNNIIKKQKIL